ncbi:TIGR03915 family putative DNA repair protein [Oscillibacter sp.]|uniref:TIGR03915 family putative DNA repair protein n=1 Tax=Oscillibacter sp. TaxID=1945593 RepID=UPI00262F9D76|nr:TIGR03915 family putative DNA repair protein [Oscillibacter sp.]MDD3347560.1 TIGR03915 family putative DNA repair protein [Oscillibacter sp.]
MTEMVYVYDGSFEGFLSCIFESYANKEVLTAICRDEDFAPQLFACRFIETNVEYANRVIRKVVKCSPYAAELLRKGFLSCLSDREILLYHLVVKLLRQGPHFLANFSDETLNPVVRAVRHLEGEAHLLKGFVRFSELGGVLGSEIEPKNQVLPILRSHFCARYRNERFFIYDRTHRQALFYAAGKAVIRPLEAFQMAPPDETEANYRILWKRFYDTVAIKERFNPRCQQTHMPKRYWKTMTEFQDDAYFTAQSSPASAAIPGAPSETPAPARLSESGTSAPASAP